MPGQGQTAAAKNRHRAQPAPSCHGSVYVCFVRRFPSLSLRRDEPPPHAFPRDQPQCPHVYRPSVRVAVKSTVSKDTEFKCLEKSHKVYLTNATFFFCLLLFAASLHKKRTTSCVRRETMHTAGVKRRRREGKVRIRLVTDSSIERPLFCPCGESLTFVLPGRHNTAEPSKTTVRENIQTNESTSLTQVLPSTIGGHFT